MSYASIEPSDMPPSKDERRSRVIGAGRAALICVCCNVLGESSFHYLRPPTNAHDRSVFSSTNDLRLGSAIPGHSLKTFCTQDRPRTLLFFAFRHTGREGYQCHLCARCMSQQRHYAHDSRGSSKCRAPNIYSTLLESVK